MAQEQTYDLDELAVELAQYVNEQASTNMPQPVLVTVIDGSTQAGNGFVWADHAGRIVQVLAPYPTDLSGATASTPVIVWAFPPNPGDPGGFYIMLGVAMNGVDNNRRPRVTVTTITDENGGSMEGSVTSVALSMPAIFSVSGSPITGAGTFTVTLATQSANTVFSGPTSGGAATPAFRTLVADDIPSLTSAKISDFSEAVDDRVAALVIAGSNMTITYNDVANTLTFASSGGAGSSDELLGFIGMAI